MIAIRVSISMEHSCNTMEAEHSSCVFCGSGVVRAIFLEHFFFEVRRSVVIAIDQVVLS